MKYLPYIFLALLVAVASVFVLNKPKTVNAYEYDYFRIHIMANSNSTEDQQLKYLVKAKLIDFFTPYLAEVNSKEDAKKIIEENLDVATLLVNKSLKDQGVNYGANIEIKNEHFPTRYYENYCLSAGAYDAIVVTLGEGKGDNWWCVVYPPLCFVNKNNQDAQNIVYQSKILEIIEKYFR